MSFLNHSEKLQGFTAILFFSLLWVFIKYIILNIFQTPFRPDLWSYENSKNVSSIRPYVKPNSHWPPANKYVEISKKDKPLDLDSERA